MSEETPRPNPGASAARRARRIGGRPAPAPAPTPAPARDQVEPRAADLATPAPGPAADSADFEVTPPTDRAAAVRSLPLAWFPAAVLAVAAVLLLALLGVFSFRGYWAKPDVGAVHAPTNAEQERVLAAAKTCFATLNTYSYTKLDEALAAGLRCTTGTFTSDYRVAFQAQVEKYAATVKIVRTAQVNKAGVSAVSPDGKQWTVLVYGQLQIATVSTAKGQPKISPVGGVLTMDCVGGTGTDCSGGQWLVAKVDVDTGTGIGG